MRKLFAGILAALALCGCTSIAKYQDTSELRDVGNISGSRVYVYSLLSPARQAIGAHVVDAFDRHLAQRLTGHSVTVEFGNSSQTQFALAPSGFGASRLPLPRSEMIMKGAAQEAALGATYRLLIVPRFFSQTQYSGDGGSYRIGWALMEIASGDIVWQTELEGAYTPMIYDNERSEERASLIVDGAIAQMQQSGLF